LALLGWCAPLVFGLLAAVPASVLSSRIALGRLARRWGLFLTPEEAQPAPVLRAYNRAMAGSQPAIARTRPVLGPLQLAPTAADGD